jgi:3-oxoacyl-[acyl-carrier-protein] synthase III
MSNWVKKYTGTASAGEPVAFNEEEAQEPTDSGAFYALCAAVGGFAGAAAIVSAIALKNKLAPRQHECLLG